jgi:hypothetical protein
VTSSTNAARSCVRPTPSWETSTRATATSRLPLPLPLLLTLAPNP